MLGALGGVRLIARAFGALNDPGACFIGTTAACGVDPELRCERDAPLPELAISPMEDSPCKDNANATKAASFRKLILISPDPETGESAGLIFRDNTRIHCAARKAISGLDA